MGCWFPHTKGFIRWYIFVLRFGRYFALTFSFLSLFSFSDVFLFSHNAYRSLGGGVAVWLTHSIEQRGDNINGMVLQSTFASLGAYLPAVGCFFPVATKACPSCLLSQRVTDWLGIMELVESLS